MSKGVVVLIIVMVSAQTWGCAPALKLGWQGVSACGKTTLGVKLAKRLGNAPFRDGDDYHPRSNVEKMSNGVPLNDADRAPWLARIRTAALNITGSSEDSRLESGQDDAHENEERSNPVVIACSALKRHYRDILRGTEDNPQVDPKDSADGGLHPAVDKRSERLAPPSKTYFVFIDGSKETLMARIAARKGHFMKEKMLDSQLAALERPDNEGDVVFVDLEADSEAQVSQAIAGLKRLGLKLDDEM